MSTIHHLMADYIHLTIDKDICTVKYGAYPYFSIYQAPNNKHFSYFVVVVGYG